MLLDDIVHSLINRFSGRLDKASRLTVTAASRYKSHQVLNSRVLYVLADFVHVLN